MKRFSPMLRSKAEAKKENKGGQVQKRESFFVILFSVFVAILLWFYVQDAEAPDYKKTFSDVSLEMQSLSSTFSVIDGGDSTVDITLVGKRSDLNKIQASDLSAYVDLSAITQPGTYQEEIQVLLPRGTEFAGSFPKLAEVFVDQTVSVTVPVFVEMGDYKVSDGLELEAIPALEEIQVKGPKSILDQVEYAKVRTGKLGEVSASFESNLEYELYDKNDTVVRSRYVITPEKNILVKFSVYKTKVVTLKVETKYGYWKEGDYQVNISPEKVLIKGDPVLVDSLESVVALTIDETEIDATRISETVSPEKLKLPEGVSLGETLGAIKVSATLTGNGSRNFKIKLDSANVAVTPPAKGLIYRFDETELPFKIRGRYENLSGAKVEDFYLNIDLSAIVSAGEYDIPVQIVQTTATEGNFYPVGRYTVKVVVTAEE